MYVYMYIYRALTLSSFKCSSPDRVEAFVAKLAAHTYLKPYNQYY